MSKTSGVIFDIKKFAVHDGPGIRTTVFMKGCPLNCIWCHNPEGINISKEIIYYDFKCLNCQKCVQICPNDAIYKKDDKFVTIDQKCDICQKCIEVCPTSSRQIIGQDISVEKLISDIERDFIYFDSSSGGVTFSGGEPFMQPDFLKQILLECKNRDIHTAVDTSGYVRLEIFEKIIDNVDLFLYDLKLLDDKKHKFYCGTSNSLIKSNLKKLTQLKKDAIIRYSVIPNITDTDENVKLFIDFISNLKNICEVDLLPFHNVSEKYVRLGKEYKMNDTKSPSNNTLRLIQKNLEDNGFYVKIGG